MPEYKTWLRAKARCFNQRHISYPRYGGRGIVVCDEWRNDFLSFYNHIGPKPSAKHSIDRIDNNKGYEPGNVRWATGKEQSANRGELRKKIYVQICCQTKSLREWCKIHKVKYYATRSRLLLGWDVLSAFNLVPHAKRGNGLFKNSPNCIKNGF